MRKAAANCVTTFLTHNVYGACLRLRDMEAELDKKEAELKVAKEKVVGFDEARLEEIEREWEEKVGEIRGAVEGALEEKENEGEGGGRRSSLGGMQAKDATELVRMYIEEGKYVEAFLVVKEIATKEQEWKEKL